MPNLLRVFAFDSSDSMTPLDWLGGSEMDVMLRTLVGQWRGTDGSLYEIFLRGTYLDVLTIRPSGERLYTQGLIRERGGSIEWGVYPRHFDMKLLSIGVVRWTRGRSSFVWQKLQ